MQDPREICAKLSPHTTSVENVELIRAALGEAREETHLVTVDMQGVKFGDNYWVSHETITGCMFDLIPKKHPQYWEWILSVSQPAPKQISDVNMSEVALLNEKYAMNNSMETKTNDETLCSDCPPFNYPTDKTRCESCPRKADLINPKGEQP